MSKKKKTLLICLSTITALLLFTITILPQIIRNQAVSAIKKETGRSARIEKVAINPFTLTVTVKGIAIDAQGGGPFVSFGTLRASVSTASLFKMALVLDEVTIESPTIRFVRLTANSYSFGDIIALQKKNPPKQKSQRETLFSINNITINNGTIDFDDQAVTGGRQHTIRNLKVAIPFISNMPYLVETYIDPHLSALINGAPFSFSGKVKPLSKSLETSVNLDLKQFKLPELVAYLPVKPPFELTSGSLSVNAEVTYRISKEKKPELNIKGLLELNALAVNLTDGHPLMKLPSLQVKATDLAIFARKFLFETITVKGLELFASRNVKGTWMYSQLLPAAPEKRTTEPVSAAKQESAGQSQQPLVQVAAFAFNNGNVHFRDAVPTGGFKSEITGIDATVRNFSTANAATAEYNFSLMIDNEATFAADGYFALTPLSATVSSELSGLKIQRTWPYLSRFLTSPVKGSIDLSSEVAFNKELGLTVEQGKLLVTGLSARYGEKEGFDLARFEINGAGFKQKENVAEIEEVIFSKGDLSVSRQADGTISLLSLLKSSPAKSTSGGVSAKPPAGSSASAVQKQLPQREFSYRIQKFQIDKFNADFTDKTLPDKPHFALNNTSMRLSNLNGPKFTPAGLQFASTFNKATPLKARGDITPLPFRYKGNISIGRLPLRDFEAYVPANIKVYILGGFVDSDMMLDVSLKEGKPVGSFKGISGIRAFHAVDATDGEDLLKWESLQLEDIQGNLEPFNLTLRQIALNGVYSRIIIRKDGTLNLQNLSETTASSGVPPTTPQSPAKRETPPTTPGIAAPQQTAALRNPVSIEAVTIQDGTLSFTDNHLPQRFTTTFHNLGGRVSGLSSEALTMADVDLRGTLENHSPLQISGKVNPLRGDLFVDLKVSFRDIELSPVTPYTGKFLGYSVEKGKLFLDLKYRIDKKQLVSENKIFIDQFTFGEKVVSDAATHLPVKLGLALLKDRKGEINLDVPVTGSTEDPKFNVWKIAFQAIQNILVKAATSPFSLLSSMFGDGQDFSAVQFEVGTSTLSAKEKGKLDLLSKALLNRPALKIELKGYVDREKDNEAYRLELLNVKLQNEKLLDLKNGSTGNVTEATDSIGIMPDEQARYMAMVYKKERFPKPRNLFGLVKELPPDEMKKLIIANTVIGETEFQALAHDRVVAIVSYLVKNGTIPAERIFQKSDNIFKIPEKEVMPKSRVELNAIVQ